MKTLYQFNLTPMVRDFQEGKIDERTVLDECSLFVYWKLKKNPRLDDDIRQDFYLSFLPSLKKSIRTFAFRGVPFERYLLAVMKKRILSWFRSWHRIRLNWTIAGDASLAPAYAPEEAVPPPATSQVAALLGTDADGRLARPRCRRWFLIWTLKHCHLLSETDIGLTARITGCAEDWVRGMTDRLRLALERRAERLERLRRRRNRLFMLARILELRLRDELDGDLKKKYALALSQKRRSLGNTVHAIAHVGCCPSHRMIAEVTGIPKGTIDTIAARFKHMLEEENDRRQTMHTA
jgi:DNA-directed RNA polymerase specialized sigma24 family protein